VAYYGVVWVCVTMCDAASIIIFVEFVLMCMGRLFSCTTFRGTNLLVKSCNVFVVAVVNKKDSGESSFGRSRSPLQGILSVSCLSVCSIDYDHSITTLPYAHSTYYFIEKH